MRRRHRVLIREQREWIVDVEIEHPSDEGQAARIRRAESAAMEAWDRDSEAEGETTVRAYWCYAREAAT